MTTATPGPTYAESTSYTTRTAWTGWIIFAGVMMIITGTLGALEGAIAVANSNWVVFNQQNGNAVVADISAWGWIHLAIGVVVIAAGFGVFTGNIAARAVGVIAAAASIVANFLWMPVYPLWAITLIAIDVAIMWALIVHGGEMQS
jgi:hypothetical protein